MALVIEDLRLALRQFIPNVGSVDADIDDQDLQNLGPPELFALPYQLMSRTKDPERLRIKVLGRIGKHDDLTANATLDPTTVLAKLKDLAGVRLLVYTVNHRGQLRDYLAQQWWAGLGASPALRLASVDMRDTNPRVMQPARLAGKFYTAVHFRVTARNPIGPIANLKDVRCEVQLLTLPTHLWSELEHDVAYKTLNRRPSDDELELLASLGHALDDVVAKMDRLWEVKIRGELDAVESLLDEQSWEHTRFEEYGLRLDAECKRCNKTFTVTYPRSRPYPGPGITDEEAETLIYPKPPSCPHCEVTLTPKEDEHWLELVDDPAQVDDSDPLVEPDA